MLNNPLVKQYIEENDTEPMLNRLKDERVLDVYKADNKLHFTELCDEFYSTEFSKEEMHKLIEELVYLTNSLKD